MKARPRSAKKPRRAASGKKSARSNARPLFAFTPSEQRHLDLLGIGIAALSIYLGLVMYLGWSGGVVGSFIADALRFGLGAVAYVIPVAGAATAVLIVLKPLLPAPRPLRSGAACMLLGLTLAFSAQTAGLMGGQERVTNFNVEWMSSHGGLLGESLFWATSTLFSPLGSHIIAIVLIIAGGLLLTGATISTMLATAGRAAARARVSPNPLRGVRGSAADDQTAITQPVGPAQQEATTEIAMPDSEPAFDEEIFDFDSDISAYEVQAEDSGSAAPESPIEVAESDPGEPESGTDPDDPQEGDVADFADGPEQEQPELTPMGTPRGVTIANAITYRVPMAKSLGKSRPDSGPDGADHEETARKLIETLGHFGVEAKVVGIVSGPHVSRYEIRLAPGIKVKKVSELANDLAYALASTDIRILAPIPGKQAVGVEIPNSTRKMVRLGDIYDGRPAKSSPLGAWLGKGIDGNSVHVDLATMPHVLVAGTTGSGKSGCVNSILSSILMHADPNEVRLVLVDPKQVELNHYENVPHLLTPVVTSPRLAANVLSNLIAEMESRYAVMGQARARNLGELNRVRAKAGEEPLPHILCVIDELADLMMVSPAEVEDSIIRLAQKSRATGIHLVLATQRPSTDIITGTIKVNIPARIAFAVSSQTDSRVILDQGGAESLLGQGDMLFRGAGTSKMERIQGAFVNEDEIASITSHWEKQGSPEFEEKLLESNPDPEDGSSEEQDFDPDSDELLEQAIRLVIETDTASVSMIQRRLRVGYTRAGRIIDMLERRGVISGYEGSKPRQVLVTEANIPRILGWGRGGSEDAGADDVTGSEAGSINEASTESQGGSPEDDTAKIQA